METNKLMLSWKFCIMLGTKNSEVKDTVASNRLLYLVDKVKIIGHVIRMTAYDSIIISFSG